MAKFWDTHDVSDFDEELEELAEPVFVRDTAINAHLQSSEVEAVQQIAPSKGVAPQELIREWVLQKLARRKGDGPTKCSN